MTTKAVIKFFKDVNQWEITEKLPLEPASLVSENVRSIVMSKLHIFDEADFYAMGKAELYSCLQMFLKPTDKKEFIKKLKSGLRDAWQLPSTYVLDVKNFMPFYIALQTWIRTFNQGVYPRLTTRSTACLRSSWRWMSMTISRTCARVEKRKYYQLSHSVRVL